MRDLFLITLNLNRAIDSRALNPFFLGVRNIGKRLSVEVWIN